MNASPPNRNEPNANALRGGGSKGGKRGGDNTPIGVDEETLQQDLNRYGALIANAEAIVDQNINTPLTVSRFGFVNALLRTLFRRRGE